MVINEIINRALEDAWHNQSASASIERWLELCDKEDWGHAPEDMTALVNVFGASWYFTRYIFYRGKEAARLIDEASSGDYERESILARVLAFDAGAEPDHQLEQLRLIKNEVMLQIVVCYLCGHFNQQQTEQALSWLANATLKATLVIFNLDDSSSDYRLSILGMGRMAGDEMTFGSDLDLIFLYEASSDETSHGLARKIRLLMRSLSAVSSVGALYEVDMRLRPHGTSGALLTTVNSFLEYHQSEREIWERQLMTRCSAIADHEGLGKVTLEKIMPYIFIDYDEDLLRTEIVHMRKRVEDEKGIIKGKHNVKQGRGGLMDIDFLCHFLQLKHGQAIKSLQTRSTRTVLRLFAENNGDNVCVSCRAGHY